MAELKDKLVTLEELKLVSDKVIENKGNISQLSESIVENYSELKGDISNYTELIKPLHYQYFDVTKWEENKYWSEVDTKQNASSGGYNAYPPIELESGIYSVKIPASGGNIYYNSFSFIKYGDGTSALLSTVYNNGIITLSQNVTIYITARKTNDNVLSDYMLVNGKEFPNNYLYGAFGKFTLPNYVNNSIVVDTNGNGDYKTIQEALDNCNDSETNPITIYIKRGTYNSFSMRAGGSRVRYINLIGESEELVTVISYTGNYGTPAGEIWTNGLVENITFRMHATSETFVSGGANPYAYAVHDDFGNAKVTYRNCIFKSNSGPAFGLGLGTKKSIIFDNCKFYGTSDGTFGSKNLGALFGHTSSNAADTEQYLEINNCLAVTEASDGNNGGIFISKLVDNADCTILVKNSASYKDTTVSSSLPQDLLSPYCFGNSI